MSSLIKLIKGKLMHFLDIDECVEVPGMCRNGVCRNSDGGFMCTCNEGYSLTPSHTDCIGISFSCHLCWCIKFLVKG